jgi:caffeoyl-CoA O-methyltransferase
MSTKYTSLSPQLYQYILQHRTNVKEPILDALQHETEAIGDESRMMISPDQGSFFTLLVSALGVQTAVEVGTFTGYSSICIARGLTQSGKLFCFDISEEWTSIARKYWQKAEVEQRIELKVGNALQCLQEFKPSTPIDFVFIDADKTGYDRYFEMILPHVRRNGIIVFDNMLWGGKVIQPLNQEDGIAINRLNQKLTEDPRVEVTLLTIADGLMICRKK